MSLESVKKSLWVAAKSVQLIGVLHVIHEYLFDFSSVSQ